ncbi:MAG TPA: diguanylate cyclase, partial [Actinoplanes sp.]|nr:diguanylate cyclase [Actinoplanes sp.]
MASSSAPRRLDRAAGRAAFFAVPTLAAVVLIAGIVGQVPGELALAVGVGATSLWATWILWRTALAIHHDEGKFAACRGAGFIGLGTLFVGATSILPVIRPPAFGLWCVLGVALASTFYVLGASLLPGAATSVQIRLRRMFDGLGLGVSLGFATYLITPVGRIWGLTLLITVCTAAAISMITVIVLRASLHRRSALRCGFGVIAVLSGLCTVIDLAVAHWDVVATPIVALGMVLALAVCAEGGSRLEPPPRPVVNEPEQYLSSYPLLAIPAAVGVIAAVYHLIVMGTWDRTAILLGVGMVAVLMLREVLVVRDIRQYAGQLKEKEAHFRSLIAGATDLTLVLDERLRILWQSPAAARLFGLADAEMVGHQYAELIHPEDVATAQAVIESVLAGEHEDGPPALVNARFRDGDGTWRDTESTVSDQRSVPEVAALVVHVRDVGERRQLERTLHRLSYTDQLTGLANRRALMRDLLAYRRRAGQQGTVLVIDLHGLAQINESRGRELGDAVLIEVGRRIKSLLGEEDVPARLGGNEFAVLTADGAVLAYALATRLLTLLLEPYQLPGAIVDLHVSVGLAELAGGADSDDVLRHADLARKRAHQLGRDRVEWYDPDVEMSLQRWMELE